MRSYNRHRPHHRQNRGPAPINLSDSEELVDASVGGHPGLSGSWSRDPSRARPRSTGSFRSGPGGFWQEPRDEEKSWNTSGARNRYVEDQTSPVRGEWAPAQGKWEPVNSPAGKASVGSPSSTVSSSQDPWVPEAQRGRASKTPSHSNPTPEEIVRKMIRERLGRLTQSDTERMGWVRGTDLGMVYRPAMRQHWKGQPPGLKAFVSRMVDVEIKKGKPPHVLYRLKRPVFPARSSNDKRCHQAREVGKRLQVEHVHSTSIASPPNIGVRTREGEGTVRVLGHEIATEPKSEKECFTAMNAISNLLPNILQRMQTERKRQDEEAEKIDETLRKELVIEKEMNDTLELKLRDLRLELAKKKTKNDSLELKLRNLSLETKSKLECCICWDEPPSTYFSPCGHVAVCRSCSARLDACPVCQSAITSKLVAYL